MVSAAGGLMELARGHRRLRAYRQLPILRAALLAHQAGRAISPNLELHIEPHAKAA